MIYESTGALARSGAVTAVMNRKRQEPRMTVDREQELIAAAKRGDEQALEALLIYHSPFVLSQVTPYKGRGIELEDLFFCGLDGLREGILRYNRNKKGVKLLSYARWWMHQRILRSLAQESRNIRIPVNRTRDFWRAKRARAKLLEQGHVMPTADQIGEEIGLAPDIVADLLNADMCLAIERPLRGDRVNSGTKEPLTMAGAMSCTDDPLERLAVRSEIEWAKQALIDLAKKNWCDFGRRDRTIFWAYMEADGAITLDDLGKKYRLSRERIRQIKVKGLALLEYAREKRKALEIA